LRPNTSLHNEVFVFMSPRNRVAQLNLQALGSLFVASYDSQGYGGGILPRVHTRLLALVMVIMTTIIIIIIIIIIMRPDMRVFHRNASCGLCGLFLFNFPETGCELSGRRSPQSRYSGSLKHCENTNLNVVFNF
jgi:hypothetical protein